MAISLFSPPSVTMAKKHRKGAARPAAIPEVRERVPWWVAWPIFAVWGFFVFKGYYSRFPVDPDSLFVMLSPQQYAAGIWHVVPGHLLNLALAAFFMFSCFSLGRAALMAAGFKFRAALEDVAFSIGAGFGLLAAYVFLLAAFKVLYAWPVAAFLIAGCLSGLAGLRARPLAQFEGLPGSAPLDLAAVALLGLAALLNLAGTLSPEIFYDTLVYHLAVPNFYVLNHGFARMPYNFYSNLPFTHGMIYSAALLVSDEVLAKFVNYASGLLSAAVVMAMGARYFSRRAGLWGALVFYTIGHAMFSSWSAGTEALLMLFSTLAVYAVLNRSEEEPRWLWLAAVFCGLSMGVKYTGLFTAVGVMLAYAYSGRGRPVSALKNLALFTLIAAVFIGPWLVKNYAYTGNPVYPFAAGLFGVGQNSDPQKLKEFAGHASQLGAFNAGNWLMNPWNETMGLVPNSEYFGPLLLFLLPGLFLIAAPAGPSLAALWVYFLAAWITWSLTSTMVRFLMPAYPAAGLIIGAYLFSPGHKGLKLAIKTAVLAACFAGLYWAGRIFYAQGRWQPLCGLVSKDDYLGHTQPTYPYSSYSAVKFINDKLPADAKVLMVGDERSFYLKKRFIVSSVYDKNALVEYASASKDGADLYARLRADGVTHLLINTAEAIRLGRGYRMFYWDARARGVFYAFWALHAREVFAFDEKQGGASINRVAVYEIVDALPAGSPPQFNLMKEVVMKNIDAK